MRIVDLLIWEDHEHIALSDYSLPAVGILSLKYELYLNSNHFQVENHPAGHLNERSERGRLGDFPLGRWLLFKKQYKYFNLRIAVLFME